MKRVIFIATIVLLAKAVNPDMPDRLLIGFGILFIIGTIYDVIDGIKDMRR